MRLLDVIHLNIGREDDWWNQPDPDFNEDN